MRFIIALLLAIGFVAGVSSVPAATMTADSSYALAADQQPPTGQIEVDIDTGGEAWWANPLWIAIGAIALVVVILLVVMAARGGGTTVIKE